MTKISACIITKNEAMCISRCLQSVKDIVDEIIVVDTGSTDATVTIAEQFGTKVFHYSWGNDFAAVRNYALDQAKGDWIIFLDADEYIAAERIKNVRPIIEKVHGNRKIDAVRCQMKNLEGVNGSLRSSNPSMRIFRSSKAIRYIGKVHEYILKREKPVSAINVDSQMLVIYHTGYSKTTITEKIRRNTALLEEELKQGIVRRLTYYYLSDGYFQAGEYEKAIDFAQKAIKDMAQMNRDCDYKPYGILIESITHLKTFSEQEAIAICNEALGRFPHHPEIWLHQAYYYRSIGWYEKSLTSLLKAVETNACYNDFNRSNDFYQCSSMAYFDIAQIYEMKNQSAQALDYYVKALQQEKSNQAAFGGLISIIRNQEPAHVIYFLNTLYEIADERDIRFLVENLSRLKVKIVLDYYHKILRDKFDDKQLNGLMLLSNCKSDEVFPIFAELFRKHGNYGMELLAVIALLISEKPQWVDLLEANLQHSCRKVVAAYFQTEQDIQLSADEFPLFCDLLRELVYLGSSKQTETFLQIGKCFFSEKACTKIATILLEHGSFFCALDMYLHCINKTSSEAKQLSDLYCDAGYCCYRLKDFAGAASYFSQALKFGFNQNRIFDFLEWSYQQCPEEAIKEKFKMMKALHRN
ncbi:hypothetical protein SPSIL_007730 [Sporomusa silvacetica DSM 10669]|uniref:Glycosyltransferase 2-like domain-containing protein n=1 Tax=Sporomusa silvacetica DSM 10669 TaxID=1123289 RepID=A0ABZ3IG67_9FIRM|nr:glycosyltransferase family 2 protein [Sporomusa silvacetica]OZC16524.1 SPBc2 prophage-derived glycosyltransferase SunS [Sporomusa silvacetica DSM 10669]